MKTRIIFLFCVSLCSCTVLHNRNEWTHSFPTDPASPWNRKVNLSVSNTPLPEVITQLEKQANEQHGPKLSLGVGRIPLEPMDTNEQTRVTFTATGITVQEAFTIIGTVAKFRAMVRGNEGVLADHGHGDGIGLTLDTQMKK